MSTRFLISVCLFLFSGNIFAFQSIVVLPFSNESQKQEIYWLGEGFAESLSEEMFLKDAYIIQRPQKMTAYDELRLPYVGHVSRATMLKIGSKLAADYVIFGSYTLQPDNKLQAKAQVIRLGSSELSAPIVAIGPLENLYNTQTSLKEGLKTYFAKERIVASDPKPASANAVSLHAYEMYIKGLLESSDAEKVEFFKRAVTAYPRYTQAMLRLGAALSRQGHYKESNDWLAKITDPGIFQTKSVFLIGLNHYLSKNYVPAMQKWTELRQTNFSIEVENNLGIASLAKGEIDNAVIYLKKAVELDADDSSSRFNLACALIQQKQDALAIQQLKEVIRLRPNDYYSFYLLAEIEKDKSSQSKRLMTHFQEILPSDQKGKFPEQYTSVIPLLRAAPVYLSAEEKKYAIITRQRDLKQRAEYVKTYQSSAQKELNNSEPDKAILEIKKGLTWAPLDWYLRYLGGQAYFAQRIHSAALAELEFSIWCMENIDSRLTMADIYRELGRYEDSKKQVQLILSLDPKNKRAMDIWGKIYDKIIR